VRTTLTIDDDVAAILEQERRRKGMSLKQVVNAALRRGLARDESLVARPEVRVRPMDLGLRAGIDPGKLNQLTDELEVEEFLRKHADKG